MDGTRSWCEADRLKALWEYGVVDAKSLTVFDDFVQIASDVCAAPVSVVNLIDKDRQWFVAEIGLGVREMPLDNSICAHVMLQSNLVVVPDLALDNRFCNNPLVTGEPRLRFYAGALLRSRDGLPLGTMCVLDYKPRPEGLTPRQAFTLEALARQVMTQLELRRTIAEKDLLVEEAHHRVKNSLQMVQSLLSLEAKATGFPEVSRQLLESAGRIQTFAAMHEHLYRAGTGLEIDLADYLGKLVADQSRELAAPFGRAVTFDAEPAPWPTSEAASVGLILVELITNALKYGAGAVTVTLRQSADDTALSVEDEGRGLPGDFVPSDSNGLGMRLVTGLLKARRGQLEIDRSRGHTCLIAKLQRPLTLTQSAGMPAAG